MLESDIGDSLAVSYRPETALVEELLPQLRFGRTGRRSVPRRLLLGKILTSVRTEQDVTVLTLPAPPDVTVNWRDFPQSTAGLRWPSAWDVSQHTLVLFPDRCPVREAGLVRVELDDPEGTRRAGELLAPYRATVTQPRPGEFPLVFLNYRSGDDTEVVDKLDVELRRRLGDTAVFRDRRSMTAGQQFPRLLRERASRAKVLVAVIGPRWERARTEPDWTGQEIALALRHNRHVVPLMVGLRPPLDSGQLPHDISALAHLNYLPVRDRYRQQDIVTVVDELIDQAPPLCGKSGRH